MTQHTEEAVCGLLSRAATAGWVGEPDAPAPVVWDFERVVPAIENLPVEFLGSAAVAALSDTDALLYQARDESKREQALGYHGLRCELASWLESRQGLSPLDPENLILTHGAVVAAALAVSAFVDPGEGAIVEGLTWPSMVRFLRMRGADVRATESDEHGIVIESLEQRLADFKRDGIRPKLLYLIPTFNLPTLAVLSLERRERIIQLAEEWDLVVVEDGEYSELGYDGFTAPPSLLSIDSSGRVIQSGSFSKLIAPALRIGWMCGDRRMIDALAAARQDLGVSQWLARVVEAFLAEDKLAPHVERSLAIQAAKRDNACNALRVHCADTLRTKPSQGGIHLWVRVDDRVDWESAAHEAAVAGVKIVSRDPLGPTGRPARNHDDPHFFRLGFGMFSHEEMEEGVSVLGAAFDRHLHG